MFQNKDAAIEAMQSIKDNKLSDKIFVAYFDDSNNLRWISR